MKCSVCGADMKNGRCTFCGFRPTAQDIESEKAWAEEKKALSARDGGPAGKIRMPRAPVRPKAGRPVTPPSVRKDRQAPEGRARAKMPPKPPAKPAKNAGKGKRAASGRPGRVPVIIRLVIIAWILFCAWTFCTVMAREYGIDIPGTVLKLFQWIVTKIDGEPEYIVPEGNYILYG